MECLPGAQLCPKPFSTRFIQSSSLAAPDEAGFPLSALTETRGGSEGGGAAALGIQRGSERQSWDSNLRSPRLVPIPLCKQPARPQHLTNGRLKAAEWRGHVTQLTGAATSSHSQGRGLSHARGLVMPWGFPGKQPRRGGVVCRDGAEGSRCGHWASPAGMQPDHSVSPLPPFPPPGARSSRGLESWPPAV